MMKGLSRKPVKGGPQSTCEGCGKRRVLGWYDGKLLCHECEQGIRDNAKGGN